MTDDSFPPFPFAKLDENAPPMPKEKKARKTKEAKATNGRRKRKGKRRRPPETSQSAPTPTVTLSDALVEKIKRERGENDELLSVSKDDILFINGVLQSMQAFPRKQQERIIIALSKVFG